MAVAADTFGRLWLRRVLPPDVWDGSPLDKKGLTAVLASLAQNHPDKYREVSYKLNQIGRESAYVSGGNSFGLAHLRKAGIAVKNRQALAGKLQALLDDDELDDDNRNERLVKLVGQMTEKERDEIYDESDAEENPLAQQLKGAGRGNRFNLAALRGSDGLYQDHRGRIIPVPVLKSYSEGLSPLEYWASTYGARNGLIQTKLGVANGGFLSKQLVQAAHRLRVSALDADQESPTLRGLPVDTDDADNEGALLAAPAGGYPRNTVLTPKVLRAIKDKGQSRILVRSPIVMSAPDGGVYARDAGIREFGRIPGTGENIGITAGQALGEPVAQGSLGSKHSGGVAGSSKLQGGFEAINSQIQVPKTIKGGAAHAQLDGIVRSIVPAPQGGTYVTINNQQHHVNQGFELRVKPGDTVEAGDVLSEGLPNPAEVVHHKGIGEGRRYFLKTFRQVMKDSGINTHRRNIELVAAGLINHVRLNQEMGDHVPDDVVPYSILEHVYEPRKGSVAVPPRQAVGKYLERPYLHHTIGTRVRPSMLKDFQDFGVQSVDVHDQEPVFNPEMQRGMENLRHDPDWLTREYGSYLQGGLTEAVQRGSTSDTAGSSFVPSVAKGLVFGKTKKPGSILS